MRRLACCFLEGILSVVVMEAWLCGMPLFELMMLRTALCSLEGFVL